MAIREGEVTQTEFAKRVGISKAYVGEQVYDVDKNPLGCLRDSPRYDDEKHIHYLNWIIAFKEWTGAGKKVRGNDPEAIIKKYGGYKPETPPEESTKGTILDTVQAFKDFGAIPADTSLYEATRRKEVATAGIAELKYKEASGMLVNKDSVFKSLFEFGQEMASILNQIPDRMMPFIRSAIGNDIEALKLVNMLRDELHTFQSRMAEGPKEENKEQDEQ